jgi:uncharacterized BrkB/YihY/UPF0761 family membrane protein
MSPVLFNQLIVLLLIAMFATALVLLMTSKATSRPWWVPKVRTFISCFLVMSLIVLIFVLVRNPIKDADDITKGAIGALLTVGFATIINFWFSTSKSSADKDDTIKALTPPAAPTPPAPPAAPQA